MSRREWLGLGAAACIACCAVPLLVAIGGIAALGAIGTLAFGALALVVAVILIAAIVTWRQRASSRAREQSDPTTVELGPTRR